MNRDEILKELGIIFCDIFDDDEIVINLEMTAKDIEDWDSLNHINIIVASEKKFGVKFTTKEIRQVANVGEYVELIHNRLD
jgi:acyl carrier protein